MLGAVGGCARKDLLRARRDLTALLVWLGLPLLIGGLMTLAFGGSQEQPAIPVPRVLLADREGGLLDGLLRGLLAQDGVADVVEVAWVDEAQGRDSLARGEASALLVLPEGLGQALLDEQPATLELLLNPAQQVLPAMVREALEVGLEMVFVLQRLLGVTLRTLADRVEGDEPLLSIGQGFREAGERLSQALDPLLIELSTANDSEPSAGGGQGFVSMLFPGLLFMSLLFAAQGLANDLWRERELGTLRRLCLAPGGAGTALLGKLLAGATIMAAVSGLALMLACWAGQLPASRLPLAWIWSLSWGTAFLLLFQVAALHASSARAAGVLSSMLLFPLLMLGGSFFPLATLPGVLGTVGRWTPNGWAVARLQDIFDGLADPASLLLSTVILGGCAWALFLLARRRLVRRFAAEA